MKRLSFLVILLVVLVACRRESLTGPLNAPTNLQAEAGSGQIVLTWQDNSTAEEGFRIYRKLESDEVFPADFLDETPPDTETYTDVTVSSVESYVYQVQAFAGESVGELSATSNAAQPNLAANEVTLRILNVGSGSGITTSTPPGINCNSSTGGDGCSSDFEIGTLVVLSANSNEDPPSVFSGFSGGCSTTELSCEVTMDASKEVNVTYDEAEPGITVQLSGDIGAGRVVDFTGPDVGGPYINCSSDDSSDCSEADYFNIGNTVVLYAEPSEGSIFAGWEGCDEVSEGRGLDNGRCDFIVDATNVITATFLQRRDPPDIREFNASPSQVTPLPPGTPVVLSWDIAYSGTDYELEITDSEGINYDTTGRGLVEDSFTVGSIDSATTFTLEVTTDLFGSDTAQDDVTLGDGPRILRFEVGDTTITRADDTTLDWEVENADSVTLTVGDGTPETVSANPPSPRTVSPNVTTEYTLTATRAGFEPITERRTITVGLAPDFTTPLSASDTEIDEGDEVTLSWAVEGADRLTLEKDPITGPTITDPVTGTELPDSPDVTTTYTVIAVNEFDTTRSNSVPVTVNAALPDPEIQDFTAGDPEDTDFAVGGEATFAWSFVPGGATPTDLTLLINGTPAPGNCQPDDDEFDTTCIVGESASFNLRVEPGGDTFEVPIEIEVGAAPEITPTSPPFIPGPELGEYTLSWTTTGDDTITYSRLDPTPGSVLVPINPSFDSTTEIYSYTSIFPSGSIEIIANNEFGLDPNVPGQGSAKFNIP